MSFRIYLSADSEEESVRMRVMGTREAIYFERRPIFTNHDVEYAELYFTRDGSPEIYIAFYPDMEEELARITAENVGKRLGIVISGRCLHAPLITEKVETGGVIIYGKISEMKAENIIDAINEA
ncbi:MAG: SecDF P1 head subdomain-containing protein [Vulcanimicrobiota bacterium]